MFVFGSGLKQRRGIGKVCLKNKRMEINEWKGKLKIIKKCVGKGGKGVFFSAVMLTIFTISINSV